jgi:tRNA(Ile)-lysidine synthase
MSLDAIAETLSKACRLEHDQPLVVGLSGGPDSLCLLDLLHGLGYRLHVVHVNHLLRPEADKDAQLVREMVEQRGLLFYTSEVDVHKHAETFHLTVEAAARELRYHCLFEQAQQLSAQAVVVGHTADDQVETVLMHLLRGSSLSGLRGMPFRALPNAWSAEIPLVRPLLATWRTEIDRYCLDHDLHPLTDTTNQDTTYTRNRLRHELIPLLDGYQPGLRKRILRMAGLLREDDDLLENLVSQAWQSCVVEQGDGYLALRLERFRAQPMAIQRRLVRRAAENLIVGVPDITYDDIQRAVMFAHQPSSTGQSDWMAGLRLAVESGDLWVAAWEADLPPPTWPQVQAGSLLPLEVPGITPLAAGWVIQAERVTLDGESLLAALSNPDPYQVWLAEECLPEPLVVRCQQPGDEFQPLGMQGQSVRLREWMSKLKLPSRVRASWPVVCAGEAIMWVPGCQPAHLARIKPDTRQSLHLTLKKIDSA